MLEKTSRALLISACLLLVLVYCIRNIFDLDIWVHLKTGEYILNNLKFVRTDFYSYTAQGNYWFNPHWLFQVFVYLIHHYFGFPGIIIIKTIFILISFFILFFVSYKKENFFFYIPLFVIAILSSKERFYERPEFISFLFIALYLKIIHNFRNKSSKTILILPLLQILWTNIHVFSLVGLGLLAIFLIGDLISWKIDLPWNWNKNNILKDKDYFLFLKIFFFCIVASFINPFGYKVFPLALGLLRFIGNHRDILAGGISELVPPFSRTGIFSPGYFYYKIFIILTIFTFLLRYRKIDLSQFFIYVVFLHLSLSSLRNIVLFAMVGYVVGVDNLNIFLTEVQKSFRSPLLLRLLFRSLFAGYVFLTLFFNADDEISFHYYIEGKLEKKFGLHKSTFYPDGPIDFIIKNNIGGNIFNSFGFGSYFIYRCFPARKVFIDGRTDVYGEEFLRYYADIHLYENVFEHLIEKYSIDYFLLDINAYSLFKRLYADKDNWRLVYFSHNGAVFIRNIPENKELISQYEIDLEKLPLDPVEDYSSLRKKPFPISCFSKGELFIKLGLYSRAEAEYRLGLKINPKVAGFYNNLGVIYQNEGKIEQAREYYEKALKINPYLVNAVLNLGAIYQEKGELERALKLYKRILPFKAAPNATLYNHLGDIYRKKGLLRQALLCFERAILLEPDRFEFYYNKGLVLLDMAKISQALDAFYKARDLEPSLAIIYNNLAACYINLGKYERAEESLKRALELEPNLKEAKENLEKVKLLKGGQNNATK
ncbi:MAG: tetratricopeptide repeat protein [Candidatus Omnitrophica bacterium]|nr:tetratricopeptide repeat protein [Candidatus Omnitrophota bacterium]